MILYNNERANRARMFLSHPQCLILAKHRRSEDCVSWGCHTFFVSLETVFFFFIQQVTAKITNNSKLFKQACK